MVERKKKQSKLCDAHRLRKNTMYCVFFPFCFACMFYSQWTNYHHVLNVWYQPDKDDDDDDDDEVMLSIRVALSAMQYTREIALKTNLHFMVIFLYYSICVKRLRSKRRHNNNKKKME